jgi:hypothetical protein
MNSPVKGDQKPFVFWLVDTFLPSDDQTDESEQMSDHEFIVHLLFGLALVVISGLLIHQ